MGYKFIFVNRTKIKNFFDFWIIKNLPVRESISNFVYSKYYWNNNNIIIWK